MEHKLPQSNTISMKEILRRVVYKQYTSLNEMLDRIALKPEELDEILFILIVTFPEFTDESEAKLAALKDESEFTRFFPEFELLIKLINKGAAKITDATCAEKMLSIMRNIYLFRNQIFLKPVGKALSKLIITLPVNIMQRLRLYGWVGETRYMSRPSEMAQMNVLGMMALCVREDLLNVVRLIMIRQQIANMILSSIAIQFFVYTAVRTNINLLTITDKDRKENVTNSDSTLTSSSEQTDNDKDEGNDNCNYSYKPPSL